MSRHLHACTQTSPRQSVQLQAFQHGTYRPKLDCRLTGRPAGLLDLGPLLYHHRPRTGLSVYMILTDNMGRCRLPRELIETSSLLAYNGKRRQWKSSI